MVFGCYTFRNIFSLDTGLDKALPKAHVGGFDFSIVLDSGTPVGNSIVCGSIAVAKGVNFDSFSLCPLDLLAVVVFVPSSSPSLVAWSNVSLDFAAGSHSVTAVAVGAISASLRL